MPDPTRKTLSSTEVPALFGASPYVTRWLLLRKFISGEELPRPEHNRLDWGKLMQPLILQKAAHELALEVRPNIGDVYMSRGLLGCTRDAEIISPDRGPGTLETKCVFDYGVWMRDWNGGKTPPRHHELQVQTQMYVGDGVTPFRWGILCAWVCADLYFFEREPIPELWEQMEARAREFFADVAAGNEGEPFGASIEAPIIDKVFPTQALTSIDYSDHPQAEELAEKVRMFAWHRAQKQSHEKGERDLKAALRALIEHNEEARFLHGIKLRAKQINKKGFYVEPTTFTTLTAFVPQGAEKAERETDVSFETFMSGG
jgi:hypothetical protein